ncbi:hypothetical protein HMN09_00907400 [Mycena chlorophos]|uniref:Uncharacterized protein n=1 Tax=Mycena chlorophos TaxID=658473 RepID=A0A8H6SRP9_MYCCL|nr:hypothetical protein HMN09_00907400 [Mycena chlorophos]
MTTQHTLEDIRRLLEEREARYHYDAVGLLADIPVFAIPGHEPRSIQPSTSRTAFLCLKSLRELALADNKTLWSLFGDIASLFKGTSPAETLNAIVKAEFQHVEAFRSELSASQAADILTKIRLVLATANLFAIDARVEEEFDAYLPTLGVEDNASDSAITCHFRAEADRGDFFIFPYFLFVEAFLKAPLSTERIQPIPAAIAALDVLVTKTTIHEARHLVATALHGPSYRAPPILQSMFSRGAKTEQDKAEGWIEQGQAHEYFELTRYRSYLVPGLTAMSENPELHEIALRIMGQIAEGPKAGPFYSYLNDAMVAKLADRVWKGTFLTATQFFRAEDVIQFYGAYADLDKMSQAMAAKGMELSSVKTTGARQSSFQTSSNALIKAFSQANSQSNSSRRNLQPADACAATRTQKVWRSAQ